MNAAIALMLFFQVKHFVADFLYQPPYQYRNKGTFGHPGGIIHAAQHAIPTMVFCFLYAPADAAIAIAVFEFIAHYWIDWSKMNLNAKLGWGPTTSENFWRLLGFDQLLHQLTYILIIWWLL